MALDRALTMGLGCWEGGSRWRGASRAKKGGEVASTCARWRERTGARIELGMGWRLGPVVGPVGSGWGEFCAVGGDEGSGYFFSSKFFFF